MGMPSDNVLARSTWALLARAFVDYTNKDTVLEAPEYGLVGSVEVVHDLSSSATATSHPSNKFC